MQTTIDNSSYSSYSQTQSFSSDSHSDAFRGNTVANKQTTETSYSQQFSRSPNGTSMSTSTATFEQTTSKGGNDRPFGFAATQSNRESRNNAYRPDDRSDRCGNQKNNRCSNEFRNNDNSNRCGGQMGKCGNARTKNEQSHCSSQKTDCGHAQVSNDKNKCGNQQSNWSNTQVKTQQSYSSSQKTECGNSQTHADQSKCSGQQSDWSSTQVQNNQATLNVDGYNIALNKSDSSISLTNEKTGDTTKIWGDPHITTDGTTGMVNGSMTFDLPNQTKVTVGTQAQGSVSYADQLTITQGNKAYVVNGLSQNDSNPLTVDSSHNGRQLDQQTADGFTLLANSSGTGWINPLTGNAPTAADFSKA